jgi:hypothetical protein
MDKPWSLQILGGPHDGEIRTMDADLAFYRDPEPERISWAPGPSLETVTEYTIYLVVQDKRSGRRYLAHPDLRLP